MTAQNVGKVPQDLGLDQDFAVVDAQGRRFGFASTDAQLAASEQYILDSYSEDVQPTFSARVAFVFDVATDARGLTLVNVPSFSDTTQKTFPLGIQAQARTPHASSRSIRIDRLLTFAATIHPACVGCA